MQPIRWEVIPGETKASFSIRYLLMTLVTGTFRPLDGAMEHRNPFGPYLISFTADADSLWTDNPQRDLHLKGPELFHTSRFPHISFHTGVMVCNRAFKYFLKGRLIIKGIDRYISLSATHLGRSKDQAIAFEVSGKLNRPDFGLAWDTAVEGSGLILGDEVDVLVFASLRRKS